MKNGLNHHKYSNSAKYAIVSSIKKELRVHFVRNLNSEQYHQVPHKKGLKQKNKFIPKSGFSGRICFAVMISARHTHLSSSHLNLMVTTELKETKILKVFSSFFTEV
jgi:hypothetical protein